MRNRCKVASVDAEGELVFVCPKCWREFSYDDYLYKHREQQQEGD